MQPSLPVPTDNIYKFSCLFGLVLIVSAIFAFVTSYSSSLDRKVKYMEVMIPLEAKTEADRTKAESSLLAMQKRLIEVTKSNEEVTQWPIGIVMAIGLALSWYGATNWRNVIQKRDDQMADLQLRKLEAEVKKVEAEANAIQAVPAAVEGTGTHTV